MKWLAGGLTFVNFATVFGLLLGMLPGGLGPVIDLLKVLLKQVSEEHGVAAKLIATTDELEQLAAGDEDVHVLHGWRREVFGNDALLLKQGRVALGVDGRRVKFIPV